MNYKAFNIGLPIKDNNVKIQDGLVQYDTANIVNVRLIDGSEPFDFTGYTDILLDILKPDGHRIVAGITSDGENTNNPYQIHVLDPAQGLIRFVLSGQATIITGTYFCTLSLFASGKVLTSARINYYVGESLLNDMDSEIESTDDYQFLLNLINRNSDIATAEQERADAEYQRELNEEERNREFKEISDSITEYIKNAEKYVQLTQEYMEEAKRYAELAQNPSQKIINELITQMNLATKEYVDDEITENTKDFIVGEINANRKKFTMGTSSTIPTLDKGEFGIDGGNNIFAGGSNGNILLSGVYVVGPTEPQYDTLLWIDTNAGGQLKYHNGSEWVPASILAFS